MTNAFAGCSKISCGRADLLDLALVHDDDAIGDLDRLFLIVGDEDARDVDARRAAGGATRAAPCRTFASSAPNGSSSSSTLRLGRERARERDALALAAGELRRDSARRARRAARARAARRPLRRSRRVGRFRHAQAERDVLEARSCGGRARSAGRRSRRCARGRGCR